MRDVILSPGDLVINWRYGRPVLGLSGLVVSVVGAGDRVRLLNLRRQMSSHDAAILLDDDSGGAGGYTVTHVRANIAARDGSGARGGRSSR